MVTAVVVVLVVVVIVVVLLMLAAVVTEKCFSHRKSALCAEIKFYADITRQCRVC